MKLEKGKFYRLRNGDKLEVYSTDNPGEYPVHGRAFSDGETIFVCMTTEGNKTTIVQTGYDIISEWTDKPIVDWSLYPSWAKFLAHDDDGIAWIYSHRPDLEQRWWSVNEGEEYAVCSICPPEHTPKLTCDWKDSLVERPE